MEGRHAALAAAAATLIALHLGFEPGKGKELYWIVVGVFIALSMIWYPEAWVFMNPYGIENSQFFKQPEWMLVWFGWIMLLAGLFVAVRSALPV